MLAARGADRTRAGYRLAQAITEVLAPAPVAGTLLVLIAWHGASSPADALRWAVLAVLFAAVVPMAYILVGVRRRRLSDRHVGVRRERPLPLLVGVASVLVGVGSLVALRAPRELIALEAAMAVGLATSLLVTLVWKISIHVAVAAGAVVILVLAFGSPWLVLVPLVVAVGWARVVLDDHSAAQSVGGALLVSSLPRSSFPCCDSGSRRCVSLEAYSCNRNRCMHNHRGLRREASAREPGGGLEPVVRERLPALGEWDRPIYGALGALETDGERVGCDACARSLKALAQHAHQTHGLTPEEYQLISSSGAFDGFERRG